MADIVVSGHTLIFQGKEYRCATGKGGFSAGKKEGDGCTPIGTFPLRECWYRADRLQIPETKLPLRVIHENDGWCDDLKSPHYNCHIILAGEGDAKNLPPLAWMDTPLLTSPRKRAEGYERLFREDHVYDLIVPIGYNDEPVVPGRGSAIFMHLAHDDYRPTEGCIALAKQDFLAVLASLSRSPVIKIRG
jgi:L,D-peptidoglycan transpeptidase YkuD (ErfK/YbiS/YcfS/YnhG family)